MNESDIVEEPEEVKSDIILNTEEKRKKSCAKKKKKFGEHENVMLTEDECIKLKAKYSEMDLRWIIEYLSNYKLNKTGNYKSDYAAINTWVGKALIEHKIKNNGTSKHSTTTSTNAFGSIRDKIKREIQER